jgi:hypothetical protein
MINNLGGTRHAIRIDPSTRWHVIWKFQFMFVFLARNLDASYNAGHVHKTHTLLLNSF